MNDSDQSNECNARPEQTAPSGVSRQNQMPSHYVAYAKPFLTQCIFHPFGRIVQSLDAHNGLLTALATVAIAALTYFVAVYANGQLRVLSDQLIEMRGTGVQTDKIIEANQKLADAAVKQADAAILSVRTARESMVAAQRAWIGIRNARSVGAPNIGKELEVFVDYQNTGREPAIEMVYDVETFITTMDDDKSGAAIKKVNAFIESCKLTWKPLQAQVVFPTAGGFNGSSYSLSVCPESS